MNWLSTIAEHPFYEFTIILALAALLGVIGQLLKQPLIVVFIALGIIVGPSALDIVKSKDNIHLLAEIGISVLLFIVGLKLDIRIIKSVGRIALLTGLGQVLFTSLFGFFIGLALDFSALHSFYIAVALTFSSTIIIVKLLSDKKEIDSLHGQIAIGFLIVQDIVVIIVMIVLSAMQQSDDSSLVGNAVQTIVSGVALILVTVASMRWMIPYLTLRLAKSQELLSLFSVAWAVSMASAAELMGFSTEVGAFLAGFSLAASDFKDLITNRLISLRDFLLIFFFVNLGSDLNLSLIGSQVVPSLIFSVFVLIGNPIIVLIIMGAMGYKKRTSFLAGLTVAQISEFSLIFAGLGLAVGHITEQTVGLITLVGLITIGLSTYLIIYSHQIYDFLSPVLSIFQRRITFREDDLTADVDKNYDLIIIGLGRFGTKLAKMLDKHNHLKYLGIDFDPKVVKDWKKRGKSMIYGDIEDPDLWDQVPFQESKMIISTLTSTAQSEYLMKSLKKHNYSGKVFITALNNKEYEILSKMGAERVLRPYNMAATNFYYSNLEPIFSKEAPELAPLAKQSGR